MPRKVSTENSQYDSMSSDLTSNEIDIVEKIINHRYKKNALEYKIVWQGDTDDTWVKESELFDCNPQIAQYWYRVGRKKNRIDVIGGKRKRSKSGSKSNDPDVTELEKQVLSCNPFSVADDKAKTFKQLNIKRCKKNKRNIETDSNTSDSDDLSDSDGDESRYSMEVDDDMVMPKFKKPRLGSNDVVAEIENILECNRSYGNNDYLIKWVGSKVPTWISENDFIQHDALKEFQQYQETNAKSTEKRCYVYLRTSRRNADREVSLFDQEKYCLAFANHHNLNVVGVYRDNGVSAKDYKNQFALNYIVDRLKEGECILCYDVTRFSRSLIQALTVLESIRKEGGGIVHAVHDGLTWNNVATNRHNFRQLLSASQLHSEIVSEKVKRSIAYRRARGDFMGVAPYGFKTEMIDGVRKLAKNHKEIAVIKEMFAAAMTVFIERFDDLSVGKSKVSKHRRVRINFRRNLNGLTTDDYRAIVDIVNKNNRNRNDRPFTWTFVRNTMARWRGRL